MGRCGRCLLSTFVLLAFLGYGYGETQCALRRGTVGSPLTLLCPSCAAHRPFIVWYELQDGVRGEPLTEADGVDSFNRLVLNISDPSTDGGKEYLCECPDTPPECHYILVNLEVNLSADSAFVRVGDVFQISCVARSFPPPNASHFILSRNTPPFLLTNLVTIPHGVSKVIANVSKEVDSGQYTCTVNVPVENGIRLHSSDHTTVTIYHPPYIIASTDATVYQDLPESPEQSSLLVTLECIVIKTDDAVISVEWSRNEEILRTGLKYVIHNTTDGDVVINLLTVRRLTEEDLGEYKCSLFSNFSLMRDQPEAEATMSVRIDTTPTVPTTVTTSTGGASPSSSTDEVNWRTIALALAVFVIVAIFLLIVLLVALIMFSLKRKQGYSPPSEHELEPRHSPPVEEDPVREEQCPHGRQAVPNQYNPPPVRDENDRNREEREAQNQTHACVEADVHCQTVWFAVEHGAGDPKPSSPVRTSPHPTRDVATGSDREVGSLASGQSLHSRRHIEKELLPLQMTQEEFSRRGSAPASALASVTNPHPSSSHIPINPQHSLPPGLSSYGHRSSPTKKRRLSSTSVSSAMGKLWPSSSPQRRDESRQRLMTIDTSQH